MKKFFLTLCFCLIHFVLIAAAQQRIFKEYDIRGIVGNEFQVEDSSEIASAIATYLVEKDSSIKKIAIGADGRIHSPPIKMQIVQALLSMGFDVVDIGTCTTPMMSFALHTLPLDAGLMITASHNPGEYNGIKIYHRTNPVWGNEIKQIYAIYESKKFLGASKKRGNYQTHALVAPYVKYLKKLFPSLVSADLHAIVDCGNGAAGTVLPLLIKKMKWKDVALLYPEVDGTYPHHIADPTVEKYMQDLKGEVLKKQNTIGIGFDGDCDRMAPMTASGQLVKGDQLVTIFSKQIIKENPGTSIVFDISSSRFLHDLVKKWGGNPAISSTGIAQMKKKMNETQALIGGEISCHTIFKDRYFGFDDGVYGMMRLFELMQKTSLSLDQLFSDLPATFSSPTYRIPCERPLCLKIIENLKENFIHRVDAELILIDGLRVHLPHGWAIVRPSNTEAVMSIRFEGDTEQSLRDIKNEFYQLINPLLDCSILMTEGKI